MHISIPASEQQFSDNYVPPPTASTAWCQPTLLPRRRGQRRRRRCRRCRCRPPPSTSTATPSSPYSSPSLSPSSNHCCCPATTAATNKQPLCSPRPWTAEMQLQFKPAIAWTRLRIAGFCFIRRVKALRRRPSNEHVIKERCGYVRISQLVVGKDEDEDALQCIHSSNNASSCVCVRGTRLYTGLCNQSA